MSEETLHDESGGSSSLRVEVDLVDGLPQTYSSFIDRPFTAENLPAGGWSEWRKKVTTRALRIVGPFTVQTSEGPLNCADGWLCIDARGYPYPVADEEFQLIYEPAPGAPSEE